MTNKTINIAISKKNLVLVAYLIQAYEIAWTHVKINTNNNRTASANSAHSLYTCAVHTAQLHTPATHDVKKHMHLTVIQIVAAMQAYCNNSLSKSLYVQHVIQNLTIEIQSEIIDNIIQQHKMPRIESKSQRLMKKNQ